MPSLCAEPDSVIDWCATGCRELRRFRPEGPAQFRATPWDKWAPILNRPERARQGPFAVVPFQGEWRGGRLVPGRCPGLEAVGPLRGGYDTFAHRKLRFERGLLCACREQAPSARWQQAATVQGIAHLALERLRGKRIVDNFDDVELPLEE